MASSTPCGVLLISKMMTWLGWSVFDSIRFAVLDFCAGCAVVATLIVVGRKRDDWSVVRYEESKRFALALVCVELSLLSVLGAESLLVLLLLLACFLDDAFVDYARERFMRGGMND